MTIVPMEERHLDDLARLERLCFSRPWSRQALKEELTNPAVCFLVGEEAGEVLGYAGMHCAAGECYVDNVAVFPEARRQGVGRKLMEALLQAAAARGGEFLSLEVRPSNLEALALYRGLGFREVGRRRRFYDDPVEDGLLLTKDLEKEEDPCCS
ncbi:MAG TPA: ribosomal protein S18-alanine N-acetyltransferase [Candidatus Acutalibacter pullistercoris]|uniref:[Ribosomal protein bS18]-alanine N-acetyltransferase n=1 Tax=Candidatus Acutalibacter pullistercoris TaxID=2838418 RepID=A0A9D1YEC6_9FIRM|nr:ribosomal protein S18-alanine N-acetyltransferase [Candidatus Acutalibacter pullistercoris]